MQVAVPQVAIACNPDGRPIPAAAAIAAAAIAAAAAAFTAAAFTAATTAAGAARECCR